MTEFLSNYGWAILGIGLMIFMHTRMGHGGHGTGGGGCCGGGHQDKPEDDAHKHPQKFEGDASDNTKLQARQEMDAIEESERKEEDKKEDKGISTCCY